MCVWVTEVFNWGGTQSEKSSLEMFLWPLVHGRRFAGRGARWEAGTVG